MRTLVSILQSIYSLGGSTYHSDSGNISSKIIVPQRNVDPLRNEHRVVPLLGAGAEAPGGRELYPKKSVYRGPRQSHDGERGALSAKRGA